MFSEYVLYLFLIHIYIYIYIYISNAWLAMDGEHPLVLGVEGDLEDLVVLRPEKHVYIYLYLYIYIYIHTYTYAYEKVCKENNYVLK